MDDEYIETPYGRFKIIEWDMRNHTDEYVELVCYAEPNEGEDE